MENIKNNNLEFASGDYAWLDSGSPTQCYVVVLGQTKGRLFTRVCEFKPVVDGERLSESNRSDSWLVNTSRLSAHLPYPKYEDFTATKNNIHITPVRGTIVCKSDDSPKGYSLMIWDGEKWVDIPPEPNPLIKN